jgi:hypothetical protein
VSRRVDRVLEKSVRNSSGGYYGVMALATFACLEFHSLFDGLVEFEFSTRVLRELGLQWLMGFSVESLRNLISAMIWFGPLFSGGSSLAGLAFIAITWGVFRLCRGVLPHDAFEPVRRDTR